MNLTWFARVTASSAFLPSLGIPDFSQPIYRIMRHIDYVGPDTLPEAVLQQRYEPVSLSD